MIDLLFKNMGVNPSLIFDLLFLAILGETFFIIMALSSMKGILIKFLRGKYRKENIAFLDTGGMEIEVVNYPRGATEIEHKLGTWGIPPDQEQLLPNGIRFILASVHTKDGLAFSIKKLGWNEEDKRRFLSPKMMANVVVTRSQQIANKFTKDWNKPMVYGTAIALVFIVSIGLYLITTKAFEYNACKLAIQAVRTAATTTTTLPPLD